MHGRHSLSIELQPWATEIAQVNGHMTIRHDVVTYPFRNHRGATTGIAAGPPCQGFSAAGGQRGRADIPLILAAAAQMHAFPSVAESILLALSQSTADPRSHLALVPWLWWLVLEPEWMLLEQVPAVLPLWRELERLARLDGVGAWAGKVCAEQYGVPQTRRRAVLLLHRGRADDQLAPVPTHSRYYEHDPSRLDPGMPKWVSMAEALGSNGTVRTVDQPAPTLLGSMDNGNVRWMVSNYGTGGDPAARGMRSTDQPAPTVTSKVDRNQWVFDRPATTIQGDPRVWPPGHKINADDRRRLADAEQRYGDRAGTGEVKVSIREAAILQSFRPDFVFPDHLTLGQRFQGVGNAVPPLLAYHLAARVL